MDVPGPAAFWLRRMLCDTAVHHYDAAATTGAAFGIADDLAADVVTEGMEMLACPGSESLKPSLVELRGRGERLGVRPDVGDGPGPGRRSAGRATQARGGNSHRSAPLGSHVSR